MARAERPTIASDDSPAPLGATLSREEGPPADPLQPPLDVDGVAGCWSFDGSDTLHPRLTPIDGLHLSVLYLDDDPVDVTDRLRAPLERRWDSHVVRPLLAAPFVPRRALRLGRGPSLTPTSASTRRR